MSKVLIYGDSLTEGIRLDKTIYNYHIETVYGGTVDELLTLNNRNIGLELYLSEDDYEIFILLIGNNEQFYYISEKIVIDGIKTLFNLCNNHVPNKIVKKIAIAIPNGGKFNKLLKELCKEENILYCDAFEMKNCSKYLLDDELHLNDAGYKYLQEKLQDLLNNKK